MSEPVLEVDLVVGDVEGQEGAFTGQDRAKELPHCSSAAPFLADPAVPGLVGKTQGPAPRH